MVVPLILLLVFANLMDSIMYEAKFDVSQMGLEFVPTNTADLLLVDSNTRKMLHCIKHCTNDIRCRTVNYDPSLHQCSLFTSWSFQGNFSPAASVQSQIGYILQKPQHYTSYLTPCVPSMNSLNRYLQCVNNLWICPDRFFFDGNICRPWRTFNQPCLTNAWCDPTQHLVCSSAFRRCRCNTSMRWNGSTCISCKCMSTRMRSDRLLVCSSLFTE